MAGAGAFVGPAVQVLALAASVALQIALAPKGPKERGPSLNNLRNTSSAYGEDIPAGFGRIRLGTKVIWATDNEVVRFKKKTGGKGALAGGGQSVTQYKYFGNFAVLVSEGEARCITRIWADRKIIFDITGGSTAFYKYPGSSIRCYFGTETQLPDPAIQADQGVDFTPAFRGSVYVVFEGLPLEDFGQRLPQIEMEADFVNPVTANEDAVTNGQTTRPAQVRFMRNNRQLYYSERTTASGFAALGRIDMDTNTNVVDLRVASPNGLFPSEISGLGYNPEAIFPHDDGKVWTAGTDGSGIRVLRVNPYSLDLLDVGEGSTVAKGPLQQEASISYSLKTQEGIKNLTLIIWHGTADMGGGADQTTFQLFDRDEGFTLRINKIGDSSGNFKQVNCSTIDRQGTIWAVGYDRNAAVDANGRRATLYRIQTEIVLDLAGAVLGQLVGAVNPLASMIFDSNGIGFDIDVDEFDLNLGGLNTTVHEPRLCAYDEPSNSLVIFGSTGDGSGNTHVIKLALDDFSVTVDRTLNDVADAALLVNGGGPERNATNWQQGAYNGGVYYIGDTLNVYRMNTSDLTTPQEQAPASASLRNNLIADRDTNSAWFFTTSSAVVPARIQYGRCNFTTVPLDEVLTQIIERSDELTAADLDFDAGITAAQVRGYTQPGRQSVRKFIEPLQFPYNFDGIESADKLKFITRGGAVTRSIAEDDLGARSGVEGSSKPEGRPELVIIDRTQEFEVPIELSFTYFDAARDQQEGTQYDRRQANPTPTQEGKDTVGIQAPLLFTADEAAKAVESGLYQQWVSRVRYDYDLGPKHMDLDPADVVEVTRLGETFTTRMIRQELVEGYASQLQAVGEDPDVYVSAAVGATVGVPGTTIALPGSTEPLVLDIPLLRDQDDGQQIASGVYVNAGAQRPGWNGASVDRSISGGSGYQEFSVFSEDAPWGFLDSDVTALPLCPAPGATNLTLVEYPPEINVWDRTSTIVIFVIDGEQNIASSTELDVLNGDNRLVIGNGETAEIVGFVNAVDNADGTWTLSTLLRGLRGTQPAAVAGHTRGDQIVIVDEDWTTREPIELNRVGLVDLYRSISVGSVAEDAVVRAFQHDAVDMSPYPVAHPRAAPIQTGATRGDVTITWERCTRLRGELDLDDFGGFEDTPLGETVESYEVDLLGKTDGLVKATKTATDPTVGVTFTTSEITTAEASGGGGYTDGDPIDVVIYQLSAVIGRGLPRQVRI